MIECAIMSTFQYICNSDTHSLKSLKSRLYYRVYRLHLYCQNRVLCTSVARNKPKLWPYEATGTALTCIWVGRLVPRACGMYSETVGCTLRLILHSHTHIGYGGSKWPYPNLWIFCHSPLFRSQQRNEMHNPDLGWSGHYDAFFSRWARSFIVMICCLVEINLIAWVCLDHLCGCLDGTFTWC